MLNPQFRKDIIPGNNHPYALVLPSQQCLSYIMSEKNILAYDSLLYARRTNVEPGSPLHRDPNDSTHVAPRIVTHKVKRGENLRSIAQKYGVSATEIKRVNNLKRGKVRTGQVLTIEIYDQDTPAPARSSSPASTLARNNMTEPASPEPSAAPTPATGTARTTDKPARQTQKPAQSSTKPAQTTYKVKKGDTLEKIGRIYGVTVADLRAANGMKPNDSRLQIDQVLKIPAKSSKSTSTPTRRKSSRR